MIFPWQTRDFSRLVSLGSKLPHGLLICGRQGIGKFEFALSLAKVLLCEDLQAGGVDCGVCKACRWFEQGNHPDFRLVQPDALALEPEGEAGEGKKKSEQIRIDQVRDLQDFLTVGTHRAGRRVIVLHPADSMNPATQNALLKNLEEPAPGTMFLVVTSQPHRLLPTVRSRCQVVGLPVPRHDVAVNWLREQGVQDPDRLLALSGGAPLAAVAGADFEEHRGRFIRGLAGPGFEPLAFAESCQQLKPVLVVDWLQRWAYDLFRSKLGAGPHYHLSEEKALDEIAARCDARAIGGFLRNLGGARALASHPLNTKLLFEDLFLQYCRLIGYPG